MQQLLDEELTDEQIADLERREAMLKRFLAWDLYAAKEEVLAGRMSTADIKRKIAEVLDVEWDEKTGEVKKKGLESQE